MVQKIRLNTTIGYNNDDVIRPLCIRLHQMIGYVKNFDSNKTMSFKASDNKLLEKYNYNRGNSNIIKNHSFCIKS